MRIEPFKYVFQYIIALILKHSMSLFVIINIKSTVCQMLSIISRLNGAVDRQTESMYISESNADNLVMKIQSNVRRNYNFECR